MLDLNKMKLVKNVGKYRINLEALVAEGLARTTRTGTILRFQRTGDLIEIAINRKSRALVVGSKPKF